LLSSCHKSLKAKKIEGQLVVIELANETGIDKLDERLVLPPDLHCVLMHEKQIKVAVMNTSMNRAVRYGEPHRNNKTFTCEKSQWTYPEKTVKLEVSNLFR
jgi:hypothetical protein